jgi:CSLREA domain-containing protein
MSTSLRLVLTFIMALCALATFTNGSAHAAPKNQYSTVNSTADTDDGSCDALGTGSGNKDCTLREAIQAVDAQKIISISFDIPTLNTSKTCSSSTGLCVIKLTRALPPISGESYIDGYTQPGACANTLKVGDNARLKIVVDGSGAGDADGFVLTAVATTVRGFNLRGFSRAAVVVESNGNTIAGNFIGTDSSGQSAAANRDGVVFDGVYNAVGGEDADARNIISGNTRYGVEMRINGNGVYGNYIGTDATGKKAIPNQTGILIAAGTGSEIGRLAAGARNVISGNQYGIDILNPASDSTIQNNFIGISANGKSKLSNTLVAIRIGSNKDQPAVSGITVSHNAIYTNGGLGIDLGGDGVTPNDNKDADAGANGLQNYPALKTATSGGSGTSIQGKLNSQPNQSFRIEFFVSAACNAGAPNNYGEGRRYIGSLKFVTNGKGNAPFTFTKSKKYSLGSVITATATQLLNDTPRSTSEFSKCVTLAA